MASDFRPQAPVYPKTHRGYLTPMERCLLLATHGITQPTEELAWSLALSLGNLRLAMRRPQEVSGPGESSDPTPRVNPPQTQEEAPEGAPIPDTPASPSPNARENPSPASSVSDCDAYSEGPSSPRGAPDLVRAPRATGLAGRASLKRTAKSPSELRNTRRRMD